MESFKLVEINSKKKKRLMLEEILLYLKEIDDLVADFRMGSMIADNFLKHSKNRSLELALAVKQKFDEYVNYRYMRDEIPLGNLHHEEIKKIINNLIEALEHNKFNEHWRIASQIEVEIEKLLKLIKFGSA